MAVIDDYTQVIKKTTGMVGDIGESKDVAELVFVETWPSDQRAVLAVFAIAS